MRNWPEYNKSLQKRGGILFDFGPDYLSKLYHEGPHARGGLKTYASQMYEYVLTITPPGPEGLVLSFDSTGINVYATSGWHQRKYGKNTQCRRSDQWKKVHIALDLETSQVMGVSYSNSNRNDCEAIVPLCEQIRGKVRCVVADGAYDLKRIFGFYGHSRTTSGRINEMIIKMNLLNQMSAMGNAQYYP